MYDHFYRPIASLDSLELLPVQLELLQAAGGSGRISGAGGRISVRMGNSVRKKSEIDFVEFVCMMYGDGLGDSRRAKTFQKAVGGGRGGGKQCVRERLTTFSNVWNRPEHSHTS